VPGPLLVAAAVVLQCSGSRRTLRIAAVVIPAIIGYIDGAFATSRARELLGIPLTDDLRPGVLLLATVRWTWSGLLPSVLVIKRKSERYRIKSTTAIPRNRL
jgi:hypothetical protein